MSSDMNISLKHVEANGVSGYTSKVGRTMPCRYPKDIAEDWPVRLLKDVGAFFVIQYMITNEILEPHVLEVRHRGFAPKCVPLKGLCQGVIAML